MLVVVVGLAQTLVVLEELVAAVLVLKIVLFWLR
jgi:hypothetical protein